MDEKYCCSFSFRYEIQGNVEQYGIEIYINRTYKTTYIYTFYSKNK